MISIFKNVLYVSNITPFFQENRVRYNQENYMKVFGDHKENLARIQASEKEPSLQELLVRWLERTPGLDSKGFSFWKVYKMSVDGTIADQKRELEVTVRRIYFA